MHDKYAYEAGQMALHDTYVDRFMAFGVAGFSVAVDSLSAIKYAKVKPIRNKEGIAVDFEIEGDFPKYGNDDDRVDDIAIYIVKTFMSKLKKYKTLSVIPLAVTFIGVIIGFICGSITYYEVGIGISLAFFVCAAACQIVFLLNFKNSTNTDELKEEIAEKFKRSIFEFTFNTFTALLCIEALVLSADNRFLMWSGPALSIAIFLISFLVKSIIIKKNHVKSNEKEKKKAKLYIKVFISFVCIIAILVSAMLLININSQSWIEKPRIFYVTDSTSEISDYLADSFRDYFDDDALLNHDDFSVKLSGNKIEFSDFIESELFIHGYSIDIIEKDGKECTRVKLWTRETFENSKNLIDTINGIFIVLYSVCIASAATVYFVKLKKIK